MGSMGRASIQVIREAKLKDCLLFDAQRMAKFSHFLRDFLEIFKVVQRSNANISHM